MPVYSCRPHTAAHLLCAARKLNAPPFRPSDSRYSLLFALISDRYLSSPCGYDISCRLQEIFPCVSVVCFAMTSLILAASTVICASRLPRVITLNSIFKLHILPTLYRMILEYLYIVKKRRIFVLKFISD